MGPLTHLDCWTLKAILLVPIIIALLSTSVNHRLLNERQNILLPILFLNL